MRLSEPTTAYQLKVTLKDIKPPIWRRLLVSDCTMGELHQIIQVAMGWENYHLYAFRIDGREFTHPDMDDGELEMEDAASTMLSDVMVRGKQFYRGRNNNLYTTGAQVNIQEFYQAIVEGKTDNPTVAPSVRSNLTAVLGRDAAYRGGELTLETLIKEGRKLEPDLKGLKA